MKNKFYRCKIISFLMVLYWLLASCGFASGDSGGSVDWYTVRMFPDHSGWGIGKNLSTNEGTPSRQTLTTALIHTIDGGQIWEKVNYQIQ